MPDPELQDRNSFGALTSPPPPGTYRFVLRRTDRQPLPFKISLSYTRPVFEARAIMFKGRVCPTLFVQTQNELRMAKRRGFRYEITGPWMAHLRALASSPVAEEEPAEGGDAVVIPEGDLMELLKDELVELAEALGVSAEGNKTELAARIEPLRE